MARIANREKVASDVAKHLEGDLALEVTLPDMAKQMGMSPSTLATCLKASSTTYIQILNAERRRRFTIAFQDNPGRSMVYYAEQCGWWNTQSFSRNFKKWYGAEFEQWRSEQ